jgi:hypothetical protein
MWATDFSTCSATRSSYNLRALIISALVVYILIVMSGAVALD